MPKELGLLREEEMEMEPALAWERPSTEMVPAVEERAEEMEMEPALLLLPEAVAKMEPRLPEESDSKREPVEEERKTEPPLAPLAERMPPLGVVMEILDLAEKEIEPPVPEGEETSTAVLEAGEIEPAMVIEELEEERETEPPTPELEEALMP